MGRPAVRPRQLAAIRWYRRWTRIAVIRALLLDSGARCREARCPPAAARENSKCGGQDRRPKTSRSSHTRASLPLRLAVLRLQRTLSVTARTLRHRRRRQYGRAREDFEVDGSAHHGISRGAPQRDPKDSGSRAPGSPVWPCLPIVMATACCRSPNVTATGAVAALFGIGSWMADEPPACDSGKNIVPTYSSLAAVTVKAGCRRSRL